MDFNGTCHLSHRRLSHLSNRHLSHRRLSHLSNRHLAHRRLSHLALHPSSTSPRTLLTFSLFWYVGQAWLADLTGLTSCYQLEYKRVQNVAGSGKIAENRACLNLDAMSVPESLVHGTRTLEAPAVILVHRWLTSSARKVSCTILDAVLR